MKIDLIKLYLILIGLFVSTSLNAQFVTIPDANFVTFLQTNYASCMNGNQMDTTCAAIISETSINCNNKNISDLSGIQFFDNLQSLNCTSNNLTTLNELPAGLTTLYCVNNNLISIADFPINIIYIDCTNNLLTFSSCLTSRLDLSLPIQII
ncbi:MAG: hypothetical protein IPP71_23235 [Bacteroidetes bacterium]|nr:hypothetical protein [Bacteroidota bacterium]